MLGQTVFRAVVPWVWSDEESTRSGHVGIWVDETLMHKKTQWSTWCLLLTIFPNVVLFVRRERSLSSAGCGGWGNARQCLSTVLTGIPRTTVVPDRLAEV